MINKHLTEIYILHLFNWHYSNPHWSSRLLTSLWIFYKSHCVHMNRRAEFVLCNISLVINEWSKLTVLPPSWKKWSENLKRVMRKFFCFAFLNIPVSIPLLCQNNTSIFNLFSSSHDVMMVPLHSWCELVLPNQRTFGYADTEWVVFVGQDCALFSLLTLKSFSNPGYVL